MYQNIFYNFKGNELHLWDDESGYSSFKYNRYAYVEDKEGNYASINGKRLRKVFSWTDTEVDLGRIYESDVSPEIRVLIDKYNGIEEPSKNHVVMIFDIEISAVKGFSEPNLAENEITSISCYVYSLDRYVVFILDNLNNVKDYIKDNVDVVVCRNEKELLKKFLNYYVEVSPTIITGWNVDKFDIPYVYNRLNNLLGKKYANLLSPISIILFDEYRVRYKIAGVSVLDYMLLYKNFTYNEEPSYSLDSISLKELGKGKIKYEGSLDDLYSNNINKFIEYNLNDVVLIKLLDDKLNFIELSRNICHKGYCSYENIYYSSIYLEGSILSYLRKNNLVSYNKKKKRNYDNSKFVGAYVKDPMRGRHSWIYDIDMQSLYPSIIMSLNISPETKLGRIENWNYENYINNKEEKYIINKVNIISEVSRENLKIFLDKKTVSVSSNGVVYSLEKKGIIPSILDVWFTERQEYKKMMKKYGDKGDLEKYEYFKNRQYVQKILLNSLYGVLGLSNFRFYDIDNAEATTITGQEIIKYSEKKVNEYYNKELGTDKDYVIYLDTDSNYVSALPLIEKRYPFYKEKSEEEIIKYISEIATEVQEFINKSFDKFSKEFLNINNHKFYIKQELIAKSGFWLAKKRYALSVVNEEGIKINKFIAKGIDVVRSDFPNSFKFFMKEILNDILDNKDKLEIDKKILDFKNNIFNLNLGDVSKPTSVKNISKYYIYNKGEIPFTNYKKGSPVHVKSSIMYNNLIDYYKLNKNFRQISNNDKIRWVYLKRNNFGIEAMSYRGYDDPDEIISFIKEYIDSEKMFNNLLLEKIKDFYNSMGWGFIDYKDCIQEKLF